MNASVIAAHARFPVSVCVKNQTSPATRAAIAVTTSMIGFAFMTTLKAACAAFAAFTAPFIASSEVTHFMMLPAALMAVIVFVAACIALKAIVAVPTVTASVEMRSLFLVAQSRRPTPASTTFRTASRSPTRNPVTGESGSRPKIGLSV